jgi:hypothetical protein
MTSAIWKRDLGIFYRYGAHSQASPSRLRRYIPYACANPLPEPLTEVSCSLRFAASDAGGSPAPLAPPFICLLFAAQFTRRSQDTSARGSSGDGREDEGCLCKPFATGDCRSGTRGGRSSSPMMPRPTKVQCETAPKSSTVARQSPATNGAIAYPLGRKHIAKLIDLIE